MNDLQIGQWIRAWTNSTRCPGGIPHLGRVISVDEKAGTLWFGNQSVAWGVRCEDVAGPVRVVALVGCGKAKLDQAAPAKCLYTGPLFRAARAWVEATYSEWWILSGGHGLVHPEQVLEPYEATLNTEAERRQWTWDTFGQIVLERACGRFPDLTGDPLLVPIVVILAGQHYRRYLVPDLKAAGYQVHVPLDGMGIGQQIAWLRARLKEERER